MSKTCDKYGQGVNIEYRGHKHDIKLEEPPIDTEEYAKQLGRRYSMEEIPIKRNSLVTHVKGINHPILGKEITAMYFDNNGLQIMCGGEVFIVVGAINVVKIV